jgi:F-type H+-transporting ATPase subunit delta
LRRVVQRITATPRRNRLALLSCIRKLVAVDRARHTARVESATPLPPELRTNVEAGLRSRYGERVDATFVHEPALIGGLRIRVASDVYDGSVRGGLRALESRLGIPPDGNGTGNGPAMN